MNISEKILRFDEFKRKFPKWESDFNVYQRDDAIYQRIKCECTLKSGITHVYHATINIETGDIYLDCRKRKIFAKHITFSLIRPIHITLKTIWHLTMIGPIFCEFKKDPQKRSFWNVARSIEDIVRTPFYGLAMTAVSIGAIIAAAYNPNSLYKSRDIISLLEKKLHRTDELWYVPFPKPLSPCFSPLGNLATIEKDWARREKNGSPKKVPQNKKNIKIAMARMASLQVNFRQNTKAAFNDCYHLYPKDKAYMSAAGL